MDYVSEMLDVPPRSYPERDGGRKRRAYVTTRSFGSSAATGKVAKGNIRFDVAQVPIRSMDALIPASFAPGSFLNGLIFGSC